LTSLEFSKENELPYSTGSVVKTKKAASVSEGRFQKNIDYLFQEKR
jgi:hypothetical protein